MAKTESKTTKIKSNNIQLPRRDRYGNKGTFGKLLLICGSENISGAAFLSAKAALRSGAGMVRVLTHQNNRAIIATQLPEALITTYKSSVDSDQLDALFDWCDAILIGPGLGCNSLAVELVEDVIKKATVPVVFDADALNIIAKNDFSIKKMSVPVILTPHMVEFTRISGKSLADVIENREELAREHAMNNHCTLVLKDAVTIIASLDGATFSNTTGNDGMGTAGSGDVLAGIVTAFAVHLAPEEAAKSAVFLHGLAGDIAAEKLSNYSLIASDIIDFLPDALKKTIKK